MSSSEFLTIAQNVVLQAGRLLLEGYGNVRHIEHKGAIDLVTEFDKRSEELIITSIRKFFPEHSIWAEESGKTNASGEYQWLIDPLDGTTNFAHSFPIFSVSLALIRRNQPLVGVAYDPLRDELFSAERDHGATLNGKPIQVSSQSDLGQALLSTGFPYDVRTNPRNNFEQFENFHRRVQALRRTGSAALDCVWVASGRLDGYWEFEIKPWDIGAGALIVREAGGRVTTSDGNENVLGQEDSIVVSNGILHGQILRVLREGSNAPLP